VVDARPTQLYPEMVGRELGVIFGGRNKLTAEGPFLDLLIKFRNVLSQHSHLIVLGYSFRDQHINRCIVRWFDGDSSRRLTIVGRQGASATDSLFYRAYPRALDERLTFEPIGAETGIAKYFGNRG
jgi:hypothetical protein